MKTIVQGDIVISVRGSSFMDIKFVPYDTAYGMKIEIPIGSSRTIGPGETLTLSGLRMEIQVSAS